MQQKFVSVELDGFPNVWGKKHIKNPRILDSLGFSQPVRYFGSSQTFFGMIPTSLSVCGWQLVFVRFLRPLMVRIDQEFAWFTFHQSVVMFIPFIGSSQSPPETGVFGISYARPSLSRGIPKKIPTTQSTDQHQ